MPTLFVEILSTSFLAVMFLGRVGNEAGWDGIYKSQSRPIYTNGMKKCPAPVPIFFFWTKICPNPVPKAQDPIPIGKIPILNRQ